ncbi:MAG TPA: hypothetical protein VMR62_23105 [Bryobacteraceae bacterium]|jgi:hypothetical protein|nr:hypothetical protein [Bryobacteraceae bacterium]
MRPLLIVLASVGLVLAAPFSKTWESLGKLDSGTPIEVVTSDRAEKGEFVSSSTESLTIQTRRGEQRFLRKEVVRVVSRRQSRRLRNVLIGVGVGAAISLVTDQTLGAYLRNESNPASARPLIWTLPMVLCGGIGAAFPNYPVIYRK